MIQPAEPAARSSSSPATVHYEQPLSERMRTFLRLEFLYRQLLHHVERSSPWDTRASVTAMLDIIAILTRGDVRGDVLKELERQIQLFDRLHARPNVDEKRLSNVLRNLNEHRSRLASVGPQYLSPLRESEFLNAVKHRSAIPGGTCEFDLPDYTHWLRQDYRQRVADLEHWLSGLRPLCDGVAELLWLMREAGESTPQVASNGVFQQTLRRDASIGLLRIALPAGLGAYPEISASHHRFSIRFMTWSDVRQRAAQVTRDVPFDLKLC